jgi:hypothetical protein
VPYYLNHASFKFALNGAGVCEAFDLRGSVPAHYRGDKNLIYLLPAEYIYLADYLKTLYPRGNSLYFNNKFSGELIFFTFEAPYGDLRLLKPGVREHGVKVLYYGDHGFTNEVLNQKVPAILLTWYDVLGSRVLSADWRAWLEIPEPGAYEFNLSSRGDSRVYIDGKEVVYNKAMPVRCDRSDATGGAYFKKGIHKIEVKYDTGADTGAVNYGCDGLWLLWKKPGDAKFSIIPGTQLMPAR